MMKTRISALKYAAAAAEAAHMDIMRRVCLNTQQQSTEIYWGQDGDSQNLCPADAHKNIHTHDAD